MNGALLARTTRTSATSSGGSSASTRAADSSAAASAGLTWLAGPTMIAIRSRGSSLAVAPGTALGLGSVGGPSAAVHAVTTRPTARQDAMRRALPTRGTPSRGPTPPPRSSTLGAAVGYAAVVRPRPEEDSVSVVTVVDHPAAAAALATLRDATTSPPVFRGAARQLGTHLAARALETVPTTAATVATPLGEATTSRVAHDIVAVPVLRAGLGLLTGVLEVVDARVGMIGLARDHDTKQPAQYYRNVPRLTDRWVFLLEPMLATGGSAAAAVHELAADDAAGVTVLAVVATRTAVDRVTAALPAGGTIVTAAVDPVLDDDAYIVPGLGDFGDRLFGTT